jgi:hypothetical protein
VPLFTGLRDLVEERERLARGDLAAAAARADGGDFLLVDPLLDRGGRHAREAREFSRPQRAAEIGFQAFPDRAKIVGHVRAGDSVDPSESDETVNGLRPRSRADDGTN